MASSASLLADYAAHVNAEDCPLYELMAVPDYCQVLCEQLDYALLSRFRVSRAMRAMANAEHLLNELRPQWDSDDEGGFGGEAHEVYRSWKPEWRNGYGPLAFAAGVTLIGQEGVWTALVEGGPPGVGPLHVASKGTRFVSLRFPLGLDIRTGGLAMERCTIDGQVCDSNACVSKDASLTTVDSRVNGGADCAVICFGDLKATRCTFEDNEDIGVFVCGAQASAELVDCVIRKNGGEQCCAAGRHDQREQGARRARDRWQGHGGEGRGGQAADRLQGQHGARLVHGEIMERRKRRRDHRHPAGEDPQRRSGNDDALRLHNPYLVRCFCFALRARD